MNAHIADKKTNFCESQIGLTAGVSATYLIRVVLLALSFLLLAKFGNNPDANILLVLGVLSVNLAALAYYSPPTAAAIFFGSNYLVGRISILNSGVSVLAILSVVIIGALLTARWREGQLTHYWRERKAGAFAVSMLMVMLAIGFVGGILSPYSSWIGPSGDKSVSFLFSGYARNENSILPYVMLTHWGTFLAIGALAVLDMRDLKVFSAALTLSFTALLLAFPIEFFQFFLKAIYFECAPMGLGFENINRAYMGYLAATSSAISLAFAVNTRGWQRSAWAGWWLATALAVWFSGSKGPVLAWALCMAALFFMMRRDEFYKWFVVMLAGLCVYFSASFLMTKTFIPCGILAHYTSHNSKHLSFATRKITMGDSIALFTSPASPASPVINRIIGEGFGASTRTADPVSHQVQIHSGSLNFFLDLLRETGIIGAILFGGAVIILGVASYRKAKALPFQARRIAYMTLISFAAVLAIKLNVATETHTEDFAAIVIGVLVGAVSRKQL